MVEGNKREEKKCAYVDDGIQCKYAVVHGRMELFRVYVGVVKRSGQRMKLRTVL